MRTRWLLLAALALPVFGAVGMPTVAQASFPGTNGKIAFWRGTDTPTETRCLHYANPSGSGETPVLTCDPENKTNPRWSPNAGQLAYEGWAGQVDLVNADSTNLREFFYDTGVGTTGFAWSPDGLELAVSSYDCFGEGACTSRIDRVNVVTGAATTIHTTDDYVANPDWSPDGSKIAYSSQFQIYTINSNGTNPTAVAPGSPGQNWAPSWSPNGTQIAFVSNRDENDEIYVMNANGTAQTRLTDNFDLEATPRFSPDGTRIAFETDRDGNHEIYTMNANGTSQTRTTNNPNFDATPDWQSIPINSYVRPKGASPLRFSLVPAFSPCSAPNRTHGPPLANPSCNPPSQASDELTVGSPETNGKPAGASGGVKYFAVVGNTGTTADEADVRITVTLADVIRRGTFADYSGELSAKTTMRITDKLNNPHPNGPGAGTGDATLRATVTCTPTADPNVGSTCNLATTADAIAPGTVVEGKRTIWALGTLQLEDGGADEDAETVGDNTVFMTQGVFVP